MFARVGPVSKLGVPVLLLRNTLTVSEGRFEAKVVLPDHDDLGLSEQRLLFSQSFFGIRCGDENQLATLALVCGSRLYVYYLRLSSGRLASYRPTVRIEDLDAIPLPLESPLSVSDVVNLSNEEADEAAYRLFGLNDVEKALVEDFCRVTLPDMRHSEEPASEGDRGSKDGVCFGERRVWVAESSSRNMETYVEWFLRVLRSSFGVAKPMCATIFRVPSPGASPFCMVGIHLDQRRPAAVQYQDVAEGNLLRVLEQCASPGQSSVYDRMSEGVYYRRVMRTYLSMPVGDNGRRRSIPTVFLIKPNRIRYWTRSAALRDADSVAADLMQAGERDGTS
jgi:hypothetical protein